MATDTVRSCSRFLDKLAEMVPAKYFIDTGKVNESGSKHWHSKSVKAQKKQQATNEGKLRKRQRLDPDQPSTVQQQKAEWEQKDNGVDEEEVEFQNVDWVRGEESESKEGQRKKSKKVLLKQALKKKEKAADDAENKGAWDSAFDRAQGLKVFDDPSKLKKALKREKKQKEKKSAKWKEIQEEQKTKREEKNNKRMKNLKERTAKKIERRMKRKK